MPKLKVVRRPIVLRMGSTASPLAPPTSAPPRVEAVAEAVPEDDTTVVEVAIAMPRTSTSSVTADSRLAALKRSRSAGAHELRRTRK